ncbi:TetR/AcrR family transcriptional regulator [Glycomyces buryatensis]|uniref:TetR/AcrR family transcriptional regulator n=1 Tax=Glycomyces buryatensis TaxID=2570927 RepID=A0A4S8QI91_9ACTN|nr:TetR/AcrR family transcriptional regulator C-terminal domain-containing protein [Glycomyces buryatensis]THV41109.1 TetR/AcrR family transcriptional regulator [Glycomyces buryatensis]
MTDDTEPIWLRPERAATGRRAERSRAEITAAAITIADRGGLTAVSMRNVALELGTGAASLYRYVNGRDDLLDLMVDATATELRLEPPTGEQVRDLVAVAKQIHASMARHPWLPELMLTRPTLGPSAVAVLDHVLAVLADHPGDGQAKLEIFALLNAIVATFAINEHATAGRPEHAVAYLRHVAATGRRPRITALLNDLAASDHLPDDRRVAALTAILTGLLR